MINLKTINKADTHHELLWSLCGGIGYFFLSFFGDQLKEMWSGNGNTNITWKLADNAELQATTICTESETILINPQVRFIYLSELENQRLNE